MNSLSRLLSKIFPTFKTVSLPSSAETAKTVEEDEIDCEGAFELMHRYADLLAEGREAAALFPAVKRHIELCKDCREELEALLRAIHATNPRSVDDLPAADERRP